MAQSILSLLFLLLCTAASASASASASATPSSADAASAAANARFINASCAKTTYQELCVESLTPYASRIPPKNLQKLSQTALKLSVLYANNTAAFISKVLKIKHVNKKISAAAADCLENVGSSVSRLQQSLRELKHTDPKQRYSPPFKWHMSNVETWVSAALTGADTCLDSFSDRELNGKVKDLVQKRVVHTGQVTSNALALVNHFFGN